MIGKMNKKWILGAGTALLAALSAAGLQAEPIQLAALSNVEGKVLVNKGKGFATAKPGTQLVEGDRVIAEGTTDHLFCRRDLKPGRLPAKYWPLFGLEEQS